MKEITERHARQVFTRFEHAEAVTVESIRRCGTRDLCSNPVRDDETLRVREHAGLRQHQRHVCLPAARNPDRGDISDRKHVLV